MSEVYIFKDMKKVLPAFLSLVAALLISWVYGFTQATEPTATDPLDLNPATGCMEGLFAADLPNAERLVPSAAIIESLRGGNCIRLDNAVVRGDLDFTSLPVNGVGVNGENQISLPGAFVATNSVFEGSVNAAATPNVSVRLPGPAVFNGTQFAALDFTGIHFVQDVYFTNSHFTEGVKFEDARFDGNAGFNGAVFDRIALLSGVEIKGDFDLSATTFRSAAQVFGGQSENLILQKASFAAPVDFSNWRANWLSAESSNFDDSFNMGNSSWRDGMSFYQARFGGNAGFHNNSISGQSANFSDADFEGDISFASSNFYTQADFSNTTFAANVILNDVEFYQKALFSGSKFEATASFNNAKFFDLADFEETSFNNLELKQTTFFHIAPEWNNSIINGTINLEGLRSYAPWKTDHERLASQLAATPYFIFAEAPDPRVDRLEQKLEMILLSSIGLAAGVLVLLALQFMQ